ncbi:FAD-dependent oxidoreductase [Salibacterium salarium]|uniref:FAD-dependent oxidoreductase n=1 Tax=Salibacterium salarium TaxID=284579 RepID=A0A3R9P4H1_9BACI|nr:FAD-dependent oxidoreductase [Salibacterium salarium]RSL30144.1 FAD-dependent oxidoreductase [Salibacterium salarium]
MMGQDREIRTGTRVIQNKNRNSAQNIQSDICVVGAGIAGVSAAIEAAQLGKNVILVDGLPSLGGQAVNSIIGIFCGLFSNNKKPYPFTRGIADGILRDLGEAGHLHYRYGKNNVVMYDETALARWIENAVAEAGIKVVLGGVLRSVNKEDRRIQSINLSTRYGDMVVSADSFVDATGDASLAWQAGLPCRESADGPIYGTQMMVVEGIDSDYIPDRNELAERLKDKADDYDLVRKDGFTFAFPGKGVSLVNMTHVETPLDPVAIAKNSIEGKAQADRVFNYLKQEYPSAFCNARIRSYGQLGIRQTRWIVGKYQLTIDDVRSGRKFSDAIARTAWPIELHDQEDGYVWEPFSEDHVHYVPLGSLTPPDVNNLMAVGRCIDGDLAALSSVRVMGPCIAMGAAAAHALYLAGEGSVHDINVDNLQARIQDNLA